MPPKCTKGGMMAEPSPKHTNPYTLFLGGITAKGTFEQSVWRLAVESGWLPFLTAQHPEPKPRWKGSFNRISDDSVILFGGSDDRAYFDDVWVLKDSSDGGEWSQMDIKGIRPSKRRAHSGAVYKRKLIIFAGKDGQTKLPLKDVWTLDLDKWAWEQHNNVHFPGPPRKGHTATMLENDMFDTETSQPLGWREIVLEQGAKRPANRNHHAAASLPGNKLIIYGGRSGHDPSFPFLDDIWVFDAQKKEWNELKPIGDSRLPTMMAYPKPRIESATANLSPNEVVIAGGRDWHGKVLNDAWTIRVVDIKQGAEWRAVSPLDCAGEEISSTTTYISVGFFLGLSALLGLFLVIQYRLNSRRAPYEPIGRI